MEIFDTTVFRVIINLGRNIEMYYVYFSIMLLLTICQ